MEQIGTGQLVSALALALMAIWLVVSLGRHRIQKTLQNAAIWALIFVGAIAGVGLWQDIQDDVLPRQTHFADQGRIEVPRSRDGHYYLTLQVNGAPLSFVVDTGATDIVLTKEDAARVGLPLDELQYFGRANTANGEVRTARVRLDSIELGGVRDQNVPASVNGGDLFQSLLGMSYLQRWDRLEISDGKLVLVR